jgi:hypothetical protein
MTRKLARLLNGVDVSGARVGDAIELPSQAAEVFIEEGWAIPVEDISEADDESPRSRPRTRKDQL